jgi:uncharacterized protein (TIGR00369 family)
MTALDARPRSRTITWSDPAQTRAQLNGLDGYERLAAMQRGEAPPPPAVALLGMSLNEVERGRTVFSIVADELFENPMGTMHGGIVATLVDTAMGCAISSTLPADASFTTLELSTNYVRAITTATGRIFAEGRVIHSGGRVGTTDARVYDENGTLYAHATSTCMIIRSRQ